MRAQKVEIITVNYNTPDLTTRLYHSIRNNIFKTIKIRIIDGSDIITDRLDLLAKQDANLTIKKFDYNIHHGGGMDYAIRSSKFKYVLILDSDGAIIKKGMLKAMFDLADKDTYAVGGLVFVNDIGKNTKDGIDGIPYIHPRCMLINCDQYIKYKKFERHGAPCIYAMQDIYSRGYLHKLRKFHEINDYFNETGRGTVSRFGYNFTTEKTTTKRKKKKAIIFNILVRTSGRPKYFKNCIESILAQTYSHYNIIVSCDDDESEEYVKKMGIDNIVRVVKIERGQRKFFDNVGRWRNPAPHNLYINELTKQCVSGYIIYLDDDDAFVNKDSLKTISKKITNENQFILWRVLFPNNRLVPSDKGWGGAPICCDISGIGYSFHTNHTYYAQWDGYDLCDYVVAKRLFQMISETIYINEPLTKLQRKIAGGAGKRDDI